MGPQPILLRSVGPLPHARPWSRLRYDGSTTAASFQPPKVQGRRFFRALWASERPRRGGMSSFRPPARFDRDACGIGLVADVEGRPSRSLVDSALVGLACVRHRSAVAADGISGDGAGLLLPIPQAFFARVAREAGMAAPGGDPRLGVVTAFLDAAD